MREIALVLLLFSAVDETSQKRLLLEGIQLFDNGKYDEAIAKYREVLAESPQNTAAAYELALAYTTKSDYPKCVAAIEPVLSLESKDRPALYEALGTCLDGMGKADDAIAAYRKGLSLAPDYAPLQFNLAVTLISRQQLDEARELLKKDVVSRPAHPMGHLVLAQVLQEQGFRVPAVLEYFRYLALAPTGPRSRFAAERAEGLLNMGVQQTKAGANITIDPNSPKGEGDFGPQEMMLSMAVAAKVIPEKAKMTNADRLADQVETVLAMLDESRSEEHDFTRQTNVPFFSETGSKEWLAKNGARVEALTKWVASSGTEHPIELPR